MDKVEPPAVADGYGLSIAFLCMLDIVKSIQSLVQPVADTTTSSASAPDVPLTKPTVESPSTADTGITLILVIKPCIAPLCIYDSLQHDFVIDCLVFSINMSEFSSMDFGRICVNAVFHLLHYVMRAFCYC